MDINLLRAKVLRKEPITLDETKAVLASVRRGYRSAQPPEKKPATRKAASAKSSGITNADLDKLFG